MKDINELIKQFEDLGKEINERTKETGVTVKYGVTRIMSANAGALFGGPTCKPTPKKE